MNEYKDYYQVENDYYEKNPPSKDYFQSLVIMGVMFLAAIFLFWYGM